jgi:DNA-binding IclR family transcriptional regulator
VLNPGVKSAMRTFEVLEFFAERREPLRLHEIYSELGYPQSSTTNLLKSMVAAGYLNYNRKNRTYLPTTRVSMLGNWVPGYIQSAGNYRQMVEELQRRTDETVGLVTQNDLSIQYIILLTPDHEFQMAPQAGTMRTMADSSSGLAMMAKMKDKDVEKICRYTNYYGMTEGRRVSYKDVMREINLIRSIDYAYVAHRPTEAVSSIAMALDTDLGGVPLAIGVGGLADRIADKKPEIVEIMRDLIEAFSSGVFEKQAQHKS